MVFGLITARGDRRRRVLNEEIKASSHPVHQRASIASGSSAQGTTEPSLGYAPGAMPNAQPRITDFVPCRYRSLAACLIVGLAVLAGILALGRYAAALATLSGVDSISAFQLGGVGSLSTWFCSVLFGVACLLSVLIYSLRRHRIDDYRGRYRVWLWAAAGCLAMSLNAVAPMHQLLADAMTRWTGWSALPGGAVWWLGACGVAFAVFGLRLLLDVRESKLALIAAVSAMACWTLVVAMQLGWLNFAADQSRMLLVSGAMMGGALLLVMTVLCYARHVILDAQGLLPDRPARRRKSKLEREAAISMESADDRRAKRKSHDRVDSTRQNGRGETSNRRNAMETDEDSRASKKSSATEWVDGSSPEDDPYDDDDGGRRQRKLSKSERKRLRREKARQRG